MTALQQFYDELADLGGSSMHYEEVARHYSYALPENALEYDTLDAMQRDVIASGSHYFDRDAIRFFKGRTHGPLIAGRFWVESRKHEAPYLGINEPREYQVAYVYAYGDNRSIEKLGNFNTLDKARRAARKLAELVEREDG